MKFIINTGLAVQTMISLLIQTCMSCIKIILLYKRPTSLPSTYKTSCTVLGNGPSLNQTLENHFDFLTSTELFCVNSFVVSDYFLKLKPQNYILFDPVFFTEEGRQRENIKTVYQSLIERTAWTLHLYVPMNAKKSPFFQEFLKQNANIRPVYFNYVILEGFNWFKNWAFKNNLGMVQSQTVIVAALFLTINRRFEKIFLVGADTSWHEELRISDDNLLLLKETNFYNTEAQSKKEIALIDPAKKNRITMAFQFMGMAKVFRGYENVNTYARTMGVKIYNASAKSYIDAFDRVKL